MKIIVFTLLILTLLLADPQTYYVDKWFLSNGLNSLSKTSCLSRADG